MIERSSIDAPPACVSALWAPVPKLRSALVKGLSVAANLCRCYGRLSKSIKSVDFACAAARSSAFRLAIAEWVSPSPGCRNDDLRHESRQRQLWDLAARVLSSSQAAVLISPGCVLVRRTSEMVVASRLIAIAPPLNTSS